MDVNDYLDRIQSGPVEAPGYAYLAKLQVAHLLTVPFENLSVRHGERIVLDERLLVQKIVVRGRGGFCYELNGSFGWLLRQLGFAVTRVSARVYNASQQEFGPEFDHMALLVHLDQTYLVDVGFGDSVRQPLALPYGVAQDVSGCYRILPVEQAQDDYRLQKWTDGIWQDQYAFTTVAHELAAYTDLCDYHQSSPHSPFTGRTVCT
ncbi:MAG: arylamine N-acetyltransferase, partial [Chloroflexota bacterium]|nr:arylamine N-acetyltransferase [Chloroflexota bacterium]